MLNETEKNLLDLNSNFGIWFWCCSCWCFCYGSVSFFLKISVRCSLCQYVQGGNHCEVSVKIENYIHSGDNIYQTRCRPGRFTNTFIIIHSLMQWSFCSNIFKASYFPNRKSQVPEIVDRPLCVTWLMSCGTCHISGVRCHIIGVTCQVSHVTSNSQAVRAMERKFWEKFWWRVCHQQSLLRLVYHSVGQIFKIPA